MAWRCCTRRPTGTSRSSGRPPRSSTSARPQPAPRLRGGGALLPRRRPGPAGRAGPPGRAAGPVALLRGGRHPAAHAVDPGARRRAVAGGPRPPRRSSLDRPPSLARTSVRNYTCRSPASLLRWVRTPEVVRPPRRFVLWTLHHTTAVGGRTHRRGAPGGARQGTRHGDEPDREAAMARAP